jgi:hypothetical protein
MTQNRPWKFLDFAEERWLPSQWMPGHRWGLYTRAYRAVSERFEYHAVHSLLFRKVREAVYFRDGQTMVINTR